MKALKSLNKYFYRYKWHFISGFFFVAISNLFAIYPARIIKFSVDLVVETLNASALFSGFEMKLHYYQFFGKTILIFSALLFLMALLKGVFMFFMRQTLIVMSRHIEYDQKNEIYNHYQKLSLSFYKVNNTGDLMTRISEDVSKVRMYTGPAIMYTVNLVVMFILVIAIMLNVNAKLTMYVLIPLPIMSVGIYLVNSSILRRSEKVQKQLSKITTMAQETFSGIRVIKSYNRTTSFIHNFEKESEAYKNLNIDLMRYDAAMFPVIMLLIGVSTLITVYIGGKEVIAGSISSGVIAEFIVYVNMLTWPVASIGWVTSLLQQAIASQKRINEFLETKPDIENPTEEITNTSGAIEFRNVNFTYPETGIHAIKNLSFRVEKGQVLAITGRTGSGKSTVAQLLCRMFDVDSGQVVYNQLDIKAHNLNVLRQSIGYVPQEVILFSDTIENNLTFGLQLQNLEKEKIQHLTEQATRDADVYENIMEFGEGFKTKIGERGLKLSGGQKQRISIARAIIKQPDILIFDDCLSAVDTETEDTILRNLERIMDGKTTILIGHRISTLRNADKILVLDDGKLVEEGTHNELMQQKGYYFDMYQKQFREEEEYLV